MWDEPKEGVKVYKSEDSRKPWKDVSSLRQQDGGHGSWIFYE